MDIQLTEEQRQVRELCRQFADSELRPNARKWDLDHQFPADAVKKLAEMGLMGVAIPAELGGAGMDNVSYAVAMEEISRGCAGTGVIMSVNNSLYCDPIYKFGTEEQKRDFLVPFARGERLGAFALTEPTSGSDAAEMRTVAVKKGDEYVLNGTKNFITNGPQADVVLVFAVTDRSKGHKGIERLPGSRIGEGLHPEQGRREARHPGVRLLHALLRGRASSRSASGWEARGRGSRWPCRPSTAAGSASPRRRSASPRPPTRRRSPTPRSARPSASPSPSSRPSSSCWPTWPPRSTRPGCSLWRAAWMKDQGVRHSAESAMAKLYASEMCERVTSKAIQIHGGYGYVKEYDVERHWRDAGSPRSTRERARSSGWSSPPTS